MKRIGILICLVLLTSLAGCNHNSTSASQSNENTTIQETMQAETETETETEIELPTLDSRYIWTKLKQTAQDRNYGAETKVDGKTYLLKQYSIEPLCEGDNIKTIEYYLENCNGTMMDENTKNPYGTNVVSKPYTLKGNNQEGIYFSVYFIFKTGLTNDKEVKQADNILENMLMRVTITYNDGSVKERLIGFKNTSVYHYKYLDLYELTLPE